MSVEYKSGIRTRIRNQPDVEECLEMCGAAVSVQSAIAITSFCWINDFDYASIAFDMTQEELM